jgi:hypothetical protein
VVKHYRWETALEQRRAVDPGIDDPGRRAAAERAREEAVMLDRDGGLHSGPPPEFKPTAVCRHCGAKIERLAREDREIWVDRDGWTSCVKAPRGGTPVAHLPLPSGI